MNGKHFGKVMLLLALTALLCVALSGCIVDPDEQNRPDDASTWKHYTEMPSAAPATPEASTPTPDPNLQSWDAPTPDPYANANITTLVPSIGAATIVPGLSGTATPTSSLAPVATVNGLLKRGSQGDAVKNVQEALRRLGYFEGKADGDFGEYTENAVKAFQAQNKLTPDGVVGPSTLARLGSSAAATAPPKSAATPTPKAKATARATATPRPTNTPNVSNTYLNKGSSGANVTKMQNRLIELGYLLGSATGKVDGMTEQGIIAFQKRNSLDDDGVAGPGTLQKMYSSSARKAGSAVGVIGMTLKLGNEGSEVRLLQSKLKSYGFLTGAVDGTFGTGTEEAVKAFQRANGLTADGKAGHGTLEKLFAGSVTSSSQAKSAATPTPKPGSTPKPTATTANTYVNVTAAPNGEYVTLERGTMGSLVTKLQRALKSAGYYSGECDGYYGEDTENAVRRFQRDKGLTQDGKAGPATQRYLYEGDFPSKA